MDNDSRDKLVQMIVQLKGVSKTYYRGDKAVHVLKYCNLEVRAGELLVIMGPSGSGKSTLLNLIGGIDYPNSGDVFIKGKAINKMNDTELTFFRRKEIGIIYQFFNLLPALTALENIALPLMLEGKNYQKTIDKATDFLDLVDLKSKADHRPEELSGGEMQRVAIARALITKPSIVLADEPTGNLDSETGKQIIDLLKQFSQKLDQTIILVTHNEEVAEQGDRLVHTKDGKIII